jgi:predicted GNAT family acetyltransferase
MAAATGPVEAMSRIGSVYTSPVERGHGYGAAVTSAVCRWVLDHGARDVVLHADLANPVSNAIYQRIGFQAVHDGRIVAFGPHN